MDDKQLAEGLDPLASLKFIVKKAYKNYNLTCDALWEYVAGSSQRTNPKVDQACGLKNNFAPKKR